MLILYKATTKCVVLVTQGILFHPHSVFNTAPAFSFSAAHSALRD